MKIAYIFFLILVLWVPIAVSAQGLKFVEEAGRVTLYDQDLPIFSYQKSTRSQNGQYPRANYVHPLYSLEGEELTEDFPADHLHHRGIFWSWHQLYVQDKRMGDPWLCEGIHWIVDTVITDTEKDHALLEARVFWVPADGLDQDYAAVAILQEHVTIRYHKPTATDYALDFEIKLLPLKPGVKIGGSEDEKGYGGFSVRLKTPQELRFYSEKGKLIPETTPVGAGGWVDIKGSYESGAGEKGGVIIMSQPHGLVNFQGWILRKKNSMQNPAFPGRMPVALEKPMVIKNRILVYQGKLSKKEIQKRYAAFMNEP